MTVKILFWLKLGLPAAVGNLNAKQNDSCTIIVEWDPPFTFIGLSVYYLITISIGEDVIISSEEVYINNYTFYPTNSSSGLYVIEVTSINDVGTGEKTSRVKCQLSDTTHIRTL